MIINVPIVNNNATVPPAMLAVESEYAVSFAAANPDGTPANCRPGGPGILGGPEYINLLQRTPASTVQAEYRVEQFELSAHPGYTFFSFNNYSTGVKNVVAFQQGLANVPDASPAFTVGVITANAGPAAGATGLTATVVAVANAVKYTWGGSAIGSITSGQGTASLVYVASATAGVTELQCVVTDSLGNVGAATPKVVTLS